MNSEKDELTEEELSGLAFTSTKAVNIDADKLDTTAYRKEAIKSLREAREKLLQDSEKNKKSGRNPN